MFGIPFELIVIQTEIMKRIMVLVGLCLGLLSFDVSAQRIRVNSNQPQQPSWGLKGHNYVSYYYLPEIGAYYYVPEKQFIYQDRGRWVTSTTLPRQLRGYNLRAARKIVVNEPKPYENHSYYSTRYRVSTAGSVTIKDARADEWSGNRSDDRTKRKQKKAPGNSHGPNK